MCTACVHSVYPLVYSGPSCSVVSLQLGPLYVHVHCAYTVHTAVATTLCTTTVYTAVYTAKYRCIQRYCSTCWELRIATLGNPGNTGIQHLAIPSIGTAPNMAVQAGLSTPEKGPFGPSNWVFSGAHLYAHMAVYTVHNPCIHRCIQRCRPLCIATMLPASYCSVASWERCVCAYTCIPLCIRLYTPLCTAIWPHLGIPGCADPGSGVPSAHMHFSGK